MSNSGSIVVLVCGGRDYSDRATVDKTLDTISPILVIHGGARGADRLAGQWALKNKVAVAEFPAEWDLYGRSAGMVRNNEMLRAEPDLVVVFPGGKGTADMRAKSIRAGVPVFDVEG